LASVSASAGIARRPKAASAKRQVVRLSMKNVPPKSPDPAERVKSNADCYDAPTSHCYIGGKPLAFS
jgi:hypothetical protein